MVDLTQDTSNPLLISAGLSQLIRKIGLMFGIGCLIGPTLILWFLLAAHLISRHELLPTIFYGGCLSGPP
jgi:hypothetical protein